MTNAVTQARPSSCTLYEIEANLQAWASCLEANEAQSFREDLLAEIGQAVQKAREKRDAVVAFLRHCRFQEEFADAEVKRIELRKALIARMRRELEAYLVRMVDEFSAPDRRGVKRLEGNVSSLRVQKNPDSVVVYDDVALPAAWKDIVLTMPAYVWEALLGRLNARRAGHFRGADQAERVPSGQAGARVRVEAGRRDSGSRFELRGSAAGDRVTLGEKR